MTIDQLYYTSCRNGLSGSPGFQVHAASQGIDETAHREVESFTAYQPPRSLDATAGPEEIARCPVNLCHVPGASTIVANVVFVGTDYSNRFGNYFAHALIMSSPRDLGDLLAIELWGAPIWSSREVDDPALDRLCPPPPRGVLDRSTVADFLRTNPGRHHVPALLSAAHDAIVHEERKLVIVDESADRVAAWIAAVSYLLPPSLTRRMSFATYQRQPRYSRTHVVGTVPGTDLARDDGDFENFFLFDFTTDRASSLTVDPCARILADLDVGVSATAWSRIARLADGTERTLDDWYPVVAAAMMTWPDGPERARDTPTVVARWLRTHADRLTPTVVDEVAAAALAQLSLGPDADASTLESLAHLAGAAGRSGTPALLARIETRTVSLMLGVARDGVLPPATMPSRLRTDQGRAHAGRAVSEQLPRLPPAVGIAVIDWAVAAGVELDEEALSGFGTRVVGPALLVAPDEPAYRSVLGERAALRRGVLAYLDDVADDETERLCAVLATGLGDTLGIGPDHPNPGLRRIAIIAEVRAGRSDPTVGLDRLLDRHRGAPLERLVTLLWCDRPWNCEEALHVLTRMTDRDPPEPQMVDRFARTVLDPGIPRHAPYVELCTALGGSPVGAHLPKAARTAVDRMSRVDDLVSELVDAVDAVAAARRYLDRARRLTGDERAHADELLLRRIDEAPPEVRVAALGRMARLCAAYCARLRDRLSTGEPDVNVAADAFLVLSLLSAAKRQPGNVAAATALDAVLRRTIGRRNHRRLNRIAAILVERHRPEAAGYVRRWGTGPANGVLGRVFSVFRGRATATDQRGAS